MASLFHKDSAEKTPAEPSVFDRIGPEIAHLQKGSSTRHGAGKELSNLPWLVMFGICIVVGLYVMDPFLYAYRKDEAIRAYLYLHTYGAGPQAGNLVASGIFSREEVAALNHRQGSFQDYFPSQDAANRQADSIVKYMGDLQLLHAGKYQKLNPIGRARYLLFIRTGIPLPTQWSVLNPSVEE